MPGEWNSGRITRPTEELLEFHRRALLRHIEVPRLAVYHQERVDYLSSLATVHTLHTPLEQANVFLLDDYRGGQAA